MATTTYSIYLKPKFADGTTRSTITIGSYADGTSSAIANAKVRIKALNSYPENIAGLYLSDSGAAFAGIDSAGVIAATRDYVFVKEGV